MEGWRTDFFGGFPHFDPAYADDAGIGSTEILQKVRASSYLPNLQTDRL